MKIKEVSALIFVSLATTSACAQRNWESDPPGNFIPKLSTEVGEDQITVVEDSNFESAARKLRFKSFEELRLEEAEGYLKSKGRKTDSRKRYFLVRAVSDRRNGAYSVFIERGVMRILWGGFGPCYKVLTNSALVVESDQSIIATYASCTGVD